MERHEQPRHHTDEARASMRAAALKRKPMSEETKRKIAEGNRKRRELARDRRRAEGAPH